MRRRDHTLVKTTALIGLRSGQSNGWITKHYQKIMCAYNENLAYWRFSLNRLAKVVALSIGWKMLNKSAALREVQGVIMPLMWSSAVFYFFHFWAHDKENKASKMMPAHFTVARLHECFPSRNFVDALDYFWCAQKNELDLFVGCHRDCKSSSLH